MESEIKIIKLLLAKKNEKFTIRKISKILKINYRIAYVNILNLEKEGIIKTNKIGNSKICELTNKFNEKIFKAEYERKEKLFKNKDFFVLYNRLSELKFPFIALLFGSYAKGTATKNSDIDILIIGGDEKEIKMTISLLPDKIHLTFVRYDEFINMTKSKEFTVVSEALKNNIILIGIEEYYRINQNAK